MNEAAYFDLKKQIFGLRKNETRPMLSGTLINWRVSWMKPIADFALQCTEKKLDSD